MVSEDFKEPFMDCQLSCASTLSRMWVIEALACSNQVDVSLLLDLVKKTPGISDAIGRNARELLSLRILESIFVVGAHANSVSSASSTKIRFDPSEHCEDALRRIILETSTSNLKTDGLEILKWDFQPFIAHKRSRLAKCALQQLKDASHPLLASLKEQSGMPVGNQSEHRIPVDESNCNGITPRLDGSDTNTHIGSANDQLISPALANCSHLLHRNFPDKNLLPAKRKRSASTENVGGRQLADTFIVIEGERCALGKQSRVVGKWKNGPPGDDNHRCTSLKRLDGPDEVLPCEKQVHHWDTEVANDKSDEKLREDQDIEGAKGDKESFCEIKTSEDVDEPNIGEGEENADISSNSDAYHNDRTDIARNMNGSFSPQFIYRQDSSATTDCRDLNLLSDTSTRIVQNSEREICSLGKKIHVGRMGHSGPYEDGNNKRTSSKRLVGLDEFLPHEKQAPHCYPIVPNETFDEEQEQDHDDEDAEGDKKGVCELKTNDEGMGPEQNVGEIEDAPIASDSDGYHDEQTNIARQNNTFFSSQFAYNQDSWAKAERRELNLCMKCNKGEKLLVCSSNSGSLVIHESCSGSGANFVSRGSRKQSKGMSCRSYGIIQNHLEQDDCLHKSNELIGDFVEKVNKRQHKKKLEIEQTGSSVLSSGDNPPGKAVDSINGIANNLNEDKPNGKWMEQESQSPRVHGQHQMASLANCKSQGENTEIRCKKGVLCPLETDLPSENTCSSSTESTYAEEISVEENGNSGASKNRRVRNQERQNSYPAIPQSRRKRLMWTIAEEQKLKEGMERFCGPNDRIIPWKKILEFGANVFHESRTTIDLKDKYRNVCRAITNLKSS